MIIWVNGPFGAGKTTAATRLAAAVPGAALFDPETVGTLLRPALSAPLPVSDFQHWRAWRTVVAAALTAVHTELFAGRDGVLVAPQTVTEESYWNEITTDLRPRPVHVVLDVGPDQHRRRVDGDEVLGPSPWRHSRYAAYREARGWLTRRATMIDTDPLDPTEVVERIRAVASV